MAKTLAFSDQPGGSEGDVVAALEELHKSADAVRKRYEQDWETNALFLGDNQWERVVSTMGATRRVPVSAPQTKVKIVSNRILPLCRQAGAALLENAMESVAVPATTEQADTDAADLETDFIRGAYDAHDERGLRRAEIIWAMTTGRVLRWTYWDPDLDGIGIGGMRMPRAGDIATKTLNPFRFQVCPWVDNFEEMPWVIVSDVRDRDEVNDLFPGRDVPAEDCSELTSRMDSLLTATAEAGQYGGGLARRKNAVILKQLFARPDLKNPKGRYWAWASGKLLGKTELPEGELPFVAIDWFPIPGRAYPLPFITPLRGLQREINATLSQLIELKNRQLRGDMVVRGVGEPDSRTDPVTGAKTVLLGPGIQEWAFIKYELDVGEAERLLLQLWNDMMQIAGLHESALGQRPARTTTATETALLKESDLAGLTIFRSGFGESYAKIDRQKGLLAKNHYDVPRLLRVVGESMEPKVTAFYGADLRNTSDVRPRPVPLATETMRRQIVQEAIVAGLYGPYADPLDKRAKLRALLNTAMPNIQEEVDKMVAPMSWDEFQQFCSELEAKQALIAAATLDMQLAQLTSPPPAPQVPGQPVPGVQQPAAAGQPVA